MRSPKIMAEFTVSEVIDGDLLKLERAGNSILIY